MTKNLLVLCLCKRKSHLYLKECLDNRLAKDIPKHCFNLPHWWRGRSVRVPVNVDLLLKQKLTLPYIHSCSCDWTEFPFYRLWSFLTIYSPVLLESKYVSMFTWLYLLNEQLLCYNCCINVKFIHYNLVSDFKTYSSFLHVLLPTGRWRYKYFT